MLKKQEKKIQHGDIWMCNLLKRSGSVQCGYRPVFILSNDKNNTFAKTINIIPLTSKMNKRNLPVHVSLWNYEEYGLKFPSTLLIEQIMTVSIFDLDSYIGHIEDEEILKSISNAISIQFQLS